MKNFFACGKSKEINNDNPILYFATGDFVGTDTNKVLQLKGDGWYRVHSAPSFRNLGSYGSIDYAAKQIYILPWVDTREQNHNAATYFKTNSAVTKSYKDPIIELFPITIVNDNIQTAYRLRYVDYDLRRLQYIDYVNKEIFFEGEFNSDLTYDLNGQEFELANNNNVDILKDGIELHISCSIKIPGSNKSSSPFLPNRMHMNLEILGKEYEDSDEIVLETITDIFNFDTENTSLNSIDKTAKKICSVLPNYKYFQMTKVKLVAKANNTDDGTVLTKLSASTPYTDWVPTDKIKTKRLNSIYL